MMEALDLIGLTFLWGKIKTAVAAVATPIGTVDMYAGGTAPDKWLLCQGQAVSREHYADLYSVIGTTYGTGDGSTTFNLPDFNDRMPIGAGSSYALNASGGSKDAIIPYHRHTLSDHTHNLSSHTHGLQSHTHTTAGGLFWHNKTDSQVTDQSHAMTTKDSATTHFFNSSKTSGGPSNNTSAGPSNNTSGKPSTNYTNYQGSNGNTTNANLPPYRGINFMIYAGVSAPTS